MDVQRVVLASAVLALAANTPAIPPEETGSPESITLDAETVAIPLDLKTGRALVRASLNGRGPYDFILDTGSSQAVIDADLARELNLPSVGQTEVHDPTAPDPFTVDEVRADVFRMGGVSLSGLTFAAFPLRDMLGDRCGGVLGISVLAEMLVTLDVPRERMLVARGELGRDEPGVVEFTSDGCPIVLEMKVNGRTLTAHLDTGNPGEIMLPRRLSEEWAFLSEPVEVGRVGTVGNTAAVWSAQIDGTIEVAGLVFQDPHVMLSGLLPAGANLGLEAFRDAVLTIDQKHGRLRIERAASAPSKRTGRRRVGVMFRGMARAVDGLPIEDGGLPVAGVAPGSYAEKAGLRPGDVILSVNGKPTVEIGTDELGRIFGAWDPIEFKIRRDGRTLTLRVD